ncbi:MAG: alpha-hydroxy acid oxidase [Candidatus Methylomirabilales bacterium]
MNLINVADYESAARAKMEPMHFGYYASGADDEITLHENREAYRRLQLQYRVLKGVGKPDLSTKLLEHDLSMPLILAPTALHRLAHPDGELATVRAAGTAGTLMMLSTLSSTPLEDVMDAAGGPLWFQLYIYKDRGITESLVRRAMAAGFGALVVTVDAPVMGRREADERSGFEPPPGVTLANLSKVGVERLQSAGGSSLAEYVAAQLKPDLSWGDIDWLASITALPVLVKGVVHPEDAAAGMDRGVAGIVVSNHGGRQLDTAPATIDVLPEIAEVLDNRVPIIVDGGVRRGTDALKALALGADAVAVGRPVLWGLAVDGEEGASRVLGILREELERAMLLCGAGRLTDLTPDLVLGSSRLRDPGG